MSQLGSASKGGGGGGGSAVETLTGDVGGAVSPTLNNINLLGGSNVTSTGNPGTSTITFDLDDAISLATSVTSPLYTVASGDLVLNMTDDVGTNSVSFTNNSDAEVAFVDSLGKGSFTDLDVDNININGNTIRSTNGNGDIILTPNGTGTVNVSYLTQFVLPISGASGAIDDIADGIGAAGEVLTSNGAGSEPTWQPAGGVSGPGSSTDNALARWDGVNGDILQDSTVIVTDAGEMTNASQPAFLARPTTPLLNVTGDGTDVPVGFDDEIFDQNGDYDTTTNIFTAPVDGRYSFTSSVYYNDLTAGHTDMNQRLITSNRTYRPLSLNPGAARNSANDIWIGITVLADMDSGDTCSVATVVSGGTKVVDIDSTAATDMRTLFSGYLVC